MRNKNLFLGITALFTVIALQSCNKKSFPDKVPADFKIEFHYDGGMVNENRNITLQMGECTDKGRYDEQDFQYKFTITDQKEIENLYQELKKLNAFSLKSKDAGQVDDRGGESVRYTINKKDYNVSDSQSKFISKEDASAFTSSIGLIVIFAELHRKAEMVKSGTTEELEGIIVEKTDSTETVILNKSSMPAEISDNAVSKGSILEMDEYTGIPPKMPNDFKIKYEMSGGISGEYRTILIQFGSCSDDGKKPGEAKYSLSWINKNLKDYENLYNELYKLNAFSLKYTAKSEVADRGGESIKYTVNKIDYIVSDKDNNYIKPGDKPTFKKAIVLILAFVDKSN